MSNNNATADPYQRTYIDPHFERSGLFELIGKQYHPNEVLYPGCSTHLTPAFFFPHIVFVDQDPAAAAFFSNHEAVLDTVKRLRRYRRTPYIQFIAQDFTRPLPVPQGQFDLLLALYAGGISKACSPYLKIGGLLLSNNHHDDAIEAAQDHELALIAVIQMRQGKYRLAKKEPNGIIQIKKASQSRRYLRQTTSGVEYIENDDYYLFERIRPR